MATKKGTDRNDVLFGGAAADILLGLGGNDRLQGGPGNDTLDGGAGNDVLIGGPGNDTLIGRAGRDSLRGDAGDDIYFIDGAGEINKALADAGSDTVKSSVSYTLGINQEHLTLTGVANLGGTGNGHANTLLGNSGANRLTGGAGADILRGGAGADVLIYDAADRLQDGGSGADTLLILGRGLALDHLSLAHARALEVLDIRGSGANSLAVDAALANRLSDTDVLRIRAGADDTVTALGAWVPRADVVLGGIDYKQFALSGATLRIEAAAKLSISSVFSLAHLNGVNGFRIDGVEVVGQSGRAVSNAGDVNGDGFDDLLIGAPFTTPHGERSGDSYVVFGKADGFAASIGLSALDGTNGFRLDGLATEDLSGWSVSTAGDVNGDGFDDLLIGAYRANTNGQRSGASYVVFGQAAGFAANINLSALNGANGFRLDGAAAGDYSGSSVSTAGDVNGDGFDDLIIGAHLAHSEFGEFGLSYVVFGKANGFAESFSLGTLNGTNGFRLSGISGDLSGYAVSSAGDVNGDGYDDLIIGATFADADPAADINNSGASYVVFGRAGGFSASIDLSALDGTNGFRLDGAAANDRSGGAVSAAGDVNGDGIADLLVGAPSADVHGSGSGASYVVFGHRTDFAARINVRTLDGSNGFRLEGGAAGDGSGWSVSSAGDVNGDGFDDLLIGTRGPSPYGFERRGATYVVFGHAGAGAASINLAALNGLNGFRLDGVAPGDYSGRAVSAAGDVNGDGFDDLIIGSAFADPHGALSGSSYVVLGRDFTGSVSRQGHTGNDILLGTSADESLIGGLGNDSIDGGGGIDVLLGGHGDDLLVWHAGARRIDGGSGNDTLQIVDSGAAFTSGESAVRHIENLDMRAGGANTVVLDALGVGALTDAPHHLTVFGDDDDMVNFLGTWAKPGGADAGFTRFTAGAITVDVASGMQVLSGGTLSLALLNGSNGFRMDGAAANDHSGHTLSDAGDINGDGFDDLLIGASGSDSNGTNAGATYVVFGHAGSTAATIDLGALDGNSGFRLDGVAAQDISGAAVSAAGDFNSDGFDDLLIGASGADPNGSNSGTTYVVFGRPTGFGASANLDTFTGSTGFRLDGVAPYDNSGITISAAGDFNGDGFDDVLIGDPKADPNGAYSGSSYLVFGHAKDFVESVNLSSLDGSNGVRFDGVAAEDLAGLAVSAAGDVNGDGFDDIIIGARGADPNGSLSGASYVVFGHASGFASSVNLGTLNGSNGFRLAGVATEDKSGSAVSSAGDVNGDGFDDILIGAYLADPNGTDSGATYVVFGASSGFSASLNLSALNGSNGFRLEGVATNDTSGNAVSAAGDVNGDGFDDLLIGARGPNLHGYNSGAAYIVFGKASDFEATTRLGNLNGHNGFRLEGVVENDFAGGDVSAVGDVNGDGFDDLLVGAAEADPHGTLSGSSYLVFGRDFTGTVAEQGGSGNDSLFGIAIDENLVGGPGDDLLDGGGGSDVLIGGSGNDTLVWDATDRHLDGGSGLDTLRFNGSDVILDLTALANHQITGIERIDLNGTGDNTLTLDIRDILGLSERTNQFIDTQTHQLLVDGNSGDVVHSSAQGWVEGETVIVEQTSYATYTHASIAAQLLVDLAITRDIN